MTCCESHDTLDTRSAEAALEHTPRGKRGRLKKGSAYHLNLPGGEQRGQARKVTKPGAK